MKNVENFFELAKSNKELSKRLVKINNHIQEKEAQDLDYNQFIKEEIVPLAQEFGVTFSVDDFVKYTKSKLPNELSDEEVANVSGGVSLKTAAITFGTLLSVSLGAAAFLGMGGLEASALETAETASSSQESSITSKAAPPKAVDNISDDEVNKMGPKILIDIDGHVYLERKQVTDTNEVYHLKAVKDKFDQQFGQKAEQNWVQNLDERIDDIESMSEEARIELQKDIRKARRSVKSQELQERLTGMLNFVQKVSREMEIAERNAEQKLVQSLTERTKNVQKMNEEERIKLKRDIRKAIKSVRNEKLREKLGDLLSFANKVSQQMLKVEREKAQKLVHELNQIKQKAMGMENMSATKLAIFILSIRLIENDIVDPMVKEELSEIKARAEQKYQEIQKKETQAKAEAAIKKIREKVKSLEDIENMSEEGLRELKNLLNMVPVSMRPEDTNKIWAKFNEERERREEEEAAQIEQNQETQLLELAKYIKEKNIKTLSDVPEEYRETFIGILNDVKENFFINNNRISSLGEVGQIIINLLNEAIAANTKTNGKQFKYRPVTLPAVASNAERFASAVIMEIFRGQITSMSQVRQRDFEAFRRDITTAVDLLQEAEMTIPDILGVIYEKIINNDEHQN